MNVLFLRSGLLLGFAAVLLQVAVFLQPLLPKQYQIAPVCETITLALAQTPFNQTQHSPAPQSHHQHQNLDQLLAADHSLQVQPASHDHHGLNHQCQYCTVFGNLVLPPELEIHAIIDRVQIRLVAFQTAFHHVYFVLQRLFLIPQGRAPPVFA